jgi:hypothetical protein
VTNTTATVVQDDVDAAGATTANTANSDFSHSRAKPRTGAGTDSEPYVFGTVYFGMDVRFVRTVGGITLEGNWLGVQTSSN